MTAPGRRARIAVLAPMRTEFRPLVRPLALERADGDDSPYHRGGIADVEIVATMTGIGTTAATMVTERLLDDHAVDHVVVVGIAGGLGPDLDVGDMVVPEIVVDRPNGRSYRATPIGGVVPAGTIVTSDEFNYPQAILDRFVAEGVLALDMETGSVAAVCEAARCPVDRVPVVERPRDKSTGRDGSARVGAARRLGERPRAPALPRAEALAHPSALAAREGVEHRDEGGGRRRGRRVPRHTTGTPRCDARRTVRAEARTVPAAVRRSSEASAAARGSRRRGTPRCGR